jgi:hypothetical protein
VIASSVGEVLAVSDPHNAELRCPDNQALRDYAAGLGPPESRERVREHAAQCPRCRHFLVFGSEGATTTLGSVFESALPLREHHPAGPPTIDPDSLGTSTDVYPSREDLESRFDFRLLAPPRQSGTLGSLGKYDVLEVLGYGGMGVVFRAHDEQLMRVVAIKVMSRELASNATSRRRFIREARAAAAINHPNVVTIHSVDEHNGTPFLVMEFIQGESMRDRLHRGPRLELVDVLRIASQISAGLAAAHAHGVIHRDIKPGNIMFQEGLQRVKITDFGLARVAVDNLDLTSREMGIGTPAYMSPEQVRGDEIDSRSDLFALGCVMYAMLRGHSPFHGRTALEIARKVADADPAPPVADPSVPPFLSEIIERLLQKSPDKRFQSAGEVAELLRRHLAVINQTATDKVGQVLQQATIAPPRKKRPVMMLGAAAVLGLAAVAALAGWPLGMFRRPVTGENVAAGRETTKGASTDSGGASSATTSQGKLALTVGQSGKADCTTIGEALRQVASGGQITILDGAEYVEAIRLTDPDRHAGVRIVSPQRATVKSNERGAVVSIRGVPNLRLEGLKVVAPQAQFGVEITGACPGVQLNDIEVQRVANPEGARGNFAAVYLRNGAGGTDKQPLVIRRMTLRSTIVGVVIGNPDSKDAGPRHIVLEESFVQGLARESSTLLVLKWQSEGIVIRRNIFARGVQGLSIVTGEDGFPTSCHIAHNTWHDVQTWIVLGDAVPNAISMEVNQNLIVDTAQISPGARVLASVANGEVTFTDNLLFNPHETSAADFAPLAKTVTDFPILSFDPTQPDYLKPDFARLKTSGSTPLPTSGRYSD